MKKPQSFLAEQPLPAIEVAPRVLRYRSRETTAKKIGAKPLVLQSSHVPMLSRPGEVADFIETAASALG